LDSLSISKPTGVAIDQATGHLWVLTFTDLIEYTKEFRQISTFPIHKDGQDQLAILNGKIYITHGLDYSKDQFVSVFDIATRRIDETYTVDKSYAIEGIAIVDSLVYIANDGLYHDAKIKRNQVNIYKLSNFN
jgi:DNA-binding beta-propeller fold protein YncE